MLSLQTALMVAVRNFLPGPLVVLIALEGCNLDVLMSIAQAYRLVPVHLTGINVCLINDVFVCPVTSVEDGQMGTDGDEVESFMGN